MTECKETRMDVFGKRAREVERARDEAIEQAQRAEADRDAFEGERDAIKAERDEIERRYNPPVRVRTEIPSGFETGRRRH